MRSALVLHGSDRDLSLVPGPCDPRVWIVPERYGVAVATCGGDAQDRGIYLAGRDVSLRLADHGVFSDSYPSDGRAEAQSRVARLPGDLFVDLREHRLVDEATWKAMGGPDLKGRLHDDQPTDGRVLVPAQEDCGPLHWARRRR